jgi:UDP-glucose 4-epimerase
VPADNRDLNYDKYFTDGKIERTVLTEFNSSNTRLLSVEEIKKILLKIPYIKEELTNWGRSEQ